VQCGVRSLHALHQVGPRGFALALQVTPRVLELLEPALDGGAGQRRLRLAGFQRRALRLEGERVGFGLRQIGARENTARSRRRGDALEALSNKQTRVYGTLESHLRRARRGAVRLRGFDARILGLPLLVPRRPRRGFHPSGSPTRAAPSTRSDQSCLGKRKIRRVRTGQPDFLAAKWLWITNPPF